jgi:hypothetical protein
MLVVCVWNTALCASVRAQTAFVLTETLKAAAFYIVDATKRFLCGYRTLMFQAVGVLDVKITVACR